jgi:hypothetical protein
VWHGVACYCMRRPCGSVGWPGMAPSVGVAPWQGLASVPLALRGSDGRGRGSDSVFCIGFERGVGGGKSATRRCRPVFSPLLPAVAYFDPNPVLGSDITSARHRPQAPENVSTCQGVNISTSPDTPLAAPPPTPPPPPTLGSSTTRRATTNPTPTPAAASPSPTRNHTMGEACSSLN